MVTRVRLNCKMFSKSRFLMIFFVPAPIKAISATTTKKLGHFPHFLIFRRTLMVTHDTKTMYCGWVLLMKRGVLMLSWTESSLVKLDESFIRKDKGDISPSDILFLLAPIFRLYASLKVVQTKLSKNNFYLKKYKVQN